jgi:hypothetical protein
MSSDDEIKRQLEGAVLPIYAVSKDGRWHAIGTSFVVSTPTPRTALALTAAHNLTFVKDAISSGTAGSHATTPPEFREPELESFVLTAPEEVLALVKAPDHRIGLAKLLKAWWTKATDIAAMLIELPEGDVSFGPTIAIDSTPIAAGSEVAVLGHPTLRAESIQDYDKEEFFSSATFGLETRVGTVTEVFPSGDSIYRWPGFLVNCPIDSGMSGGPVIDRTNTTAVARGVICGDMSLDPSNGARGSGARAYVASLWPALLMRVEAEVVGLNGDVQVPAPCVLAEWVRRGAIDGRGVVELVLRSTFVGALDGSGPK